MNIVFCSDSNYVMPSGVFMKSVSVNNVNNDIEFDAIIDESVTDEDKAALRKVIADNTKHKIVFFTVSGKDFENMPNLEVSSEYAKQMKVTALHTTKACYYRLSMAQLLPDTIKRVLYFDCDIIVTQDLLPMWNTDLEGKAVAAVKDEGELDMSYDLLGYDTKDGYFNSGAMVIDLDYWRRNEMFPEFLKIINKHNGKMRQHDQEILNIAFHDNVKLLPFKYNLQENFLRLPSTYSFYHKYSVEIERALRDYAVIHYTADKPWYADCGQPLKEYFFKYRAMTQWKNEKVTWKRPEFRRNIAIYRLLVRLRLKKDSYRKDIKREQ